MKISSFIVQLLLPVGLLAADVSLYDQARELYKQGPSNGPEIVRLVREHIQSSPKDSEAITLLGITLFGAGRFEEALPAIDRAIELASEKKVIRPNTVMLRARTLFELHRYFECKRLLEAYWAFWQDDAELKKLYDWYYLRVQNAEEKGAAAQQPRPSAVAEPPSNSTSLADVAEA